MNEQLFEQARRVNELRKAYRKASEAYQIAQDNFRESYATTIKMHADARDALISAEDHLRAAIVIAYKETGKEKFFPGLAIRKETEMDYKPEEALKWAKEHQLALKLDSKAFEAFAKSDPSAVPFVTISKVPHGTIPTDLDKALDMDATKGE